MKKTKRNKKKPKRKSQKEIELHKACQSQAQNAFERIKNLIENGEDVNIKSDYKQTPLHLVCQKQKKDNVIEIVKYLISKGADVNARNKRGKSPLDFTCQYQQKKNLIEIMKILFSNGANFKERYYPDEKPLELLLKYQKEKDILFEAMNLLIENGISLNPKKSDRPSLSHAFEYQKEYAIEIMNFLISKGLDITKKDSYKKTPLHYICRFPIKKSIEVIKFLISKGININSIDIGNETPLHLACENQADQSLEIIKYLLENGAKSSINLKTNFRKETPLHLIFQSRNRDPLEIIKLLISNGADVNSRNEKEKIPLHYACKFEQQNNFEVVKFLIANGADVNAKDQKDRTPLNYAFKCFLNNYLFTFKNSKTEIEEEVFKTIKHLIENGADVNIIDDNGKTLLQLICEKEIIHKTKNPKISEVIKLLIQKIHNIDLNIEIENDLHQKIPLFYPIYKYDQDLITLLMINNADISKLTDKQITKEMIDLFPKIYSINQDLNNLLNSNDNLSDFEIETNDSFKFKVHKQILLLRFDYNQLNLQKFINNSENKYYEYEYEYEEDEDDYYYNSYYNYGNKYTKNDSSFYREKIEENKKLKKELKTKEEELKTKETKQNEINEEFFKEIGFDLNWIKSKSKRKGIIKDLSKLYEENDSKKDFTIICSDEKEIKVHKLILFLRSELFKGMFQLNVEDKSNQVHDYSKKSFETINQFIYFLYHDEIEENKFNSKIIEEFEDIKDYYQLNLNSIIDLFLNDLISSN
ncbi:ankyrin repeat [Anaeramoeba ignava]|uniref:Ankyrin repeat n=1 Tax=Anaeramoeba ignava TaxID=1746090 RepID=A0A9Q0R953_ANAIG|nr:ankyrin repeat [Anaeramoeba ignava]